MELEVTKILKAEEVDAERKKIIDDSDIEERRKLSQYVSENKITAEPIHGGMYYIPIKSTSGIKAEEGKFVLIHGTNVIRTFNNYEDALKEAYAEFGPDEPFLVKRIQTIDQAQIISRFVIPCPTSPSR